MAQVKQATIRQSKSLTGLALHTGNKVKMTLKPAPANSGLVFCRTDLDDKPTVAVHVDNVKQVERATTLGEGNLKIHTVEHLLSALRGCQIDNVVVELDANEPPILDGSAAGFVELIQSCGREEQHATVSFFELREPVRVEGKDGAYMIAWPGETFAVSAVNANHLNKYTQHRHWDERSGNYAGEIARARTFVFYEEVEPLMEKGLIKGGSLENAIVIRGEAILAKEPLRYEDEFVRHKILDIIGDLALFPLRLKAHIYACKPSHALNVQLAQAIHKQYQRYQAQMRPVDYPMSGDSGLDSKDIMKILPHRYPFLLVDRVLRFEGDLKAVAQKSVTLNEPYFQGHFPGHPVMPGVLQLEAMAQVASIIVLRMPEFAGRLGYFMSADKVKFRKPVVPGDTIIMHVELTKARSKIAKASGQVFVNGEVVSEAELMFTVI
jgi:UDP-3-O-[3-hydroxymyristoyl] N-acetylglucosamine deacetylase/3-hydroxyacyl-[acyl-carrier-protein] dehydratase